MQTKALMLVASLIVLGLATFDASGSLQVGIYTDADTYRPEDTIEVSLSASNSGGGTSVDVYIGLIAPDGRTYTQPGSDVWDEGIHAWMMNIYLESGFAMGPKTYWWFSSPRTRPPIEEPGTYSFVAVLTRPGTLQWVCDASFALFEMRPPPPYHLYVDAESGDDGAEGTELDPWKTIAHAVDCAEGVVDSPTTVHIQPGTYSASTNGEVFPINLKDSVSLSGSDPELTILDAEGMADHVIQCEHVSDVVIESLTITGGDTIHVGGGICCESSWLTIQNNVITQNHADSGGGVGCSNSWAYVAQNTLSDNEANSGGGIYSRASCVMIVGNSIESNYGGYGAGAFSESSWVTIEDNVVNGNRGLVGGSGLYCLSSWMTIQRNTIQANYAPQGAGAGIYVGGCSCTIANNTIERNEAYYFGGGISCWDCSVRITNNIISRNSTYNQGGGIYCSGGSPIMQSNTIVNNKGSGICLFDYSVAITDCILWGNSLVPDLEGRCTAIYCCIEGDYEGIGNIHDDPMFVPGPLGEYYLDPLSPCIDAGSRSASEAGLSGWTTQADGSPDSGVVDMGAHYPIP